MFNENIINAKNKIWLILEKSDETRISQSFSNYEDTTGEIYNYDSDVQNSEKIQKNDIIILRKENVILGFGTIKNIESKPSQKSNSRCPKCNTTDVRIRKTKTPKWKCGRCTIEFENPIVTQKDITSYYAHIDSFKKIDNPPSVKSIKNCWVKPNGTSNQNSIMQLDKLKTINLISDGDSNFYDIVTNKTKKISINNDKKQQSRQEYLSNSQKKKVIELRAMDIAMKWYRKEGWDISDEPSKKKIGYDCLAKKGNQIKCIEVKGTRGAGEDIILTHGEVKFSNANRNRSVLIVIGHINLKKVDNEWIATDGKIIHLKDPWIINKKNLFSTQYRYKV